jgi:hypothetical protein
VGPQLGTQSAIVVAARLFFLSYAPLDAGPRPPPAGGAGGAGVPGLLGTFDISTRFPELHVSLVAMGAGTAVQSSGAEVAADAAVAMGGWLADTQVETESAGEALEHVQAEKASPQRSKLKLLHRLGAVAVPRPGLGGIGPSGNATSQIGWQRATVLMAGHGARRRWSARRSLRQPSWCHRTLVKSSS